jgi:hypothetical protein
MLDRRKATLAAVRLFQQVRPDAAVREVTARLIGRLWFVNFHKLLPSHVVESPGSWCVTVDARTGQAEWFETL